ncbi:MAG: hypothetical protein RMN52_14355 [Anaerolineae bacterium]|nr:hypothetical protein [Candidatus Roseilinea sp.]MDW8451178.1 hypothetical protein [Anaerolineae bacterium]
MVICLAAAGAFWAAGSSALALPGRAAAPHQPATLASITISPSLADMDLDTTQTFTATGRDASGNEITGLSVTWAVSPTAGVIVATGPTTMTFRSGTTPGDYPKAIRAAAGSVVGTANVLLRPGPPASIVISPSVVTLDINATQTFTASVFDRFGNLRSDLGVTWLTPPPVAGTIESSTANSAVFRAGTVAGTFSAGLQASNPPALQSVAITIRPGPPARVQVSASPTTLKTDGLSSSNIVALVTDQYGNPVGQGTPVSFAIESCPGACTLDPTSGVTNDQSRASTVLRSAYTSPTQTLTATIVVRASINAGAASDAVTVTGVFTPHRSLMPVVTKDWVPANHTACTALRVTPPATVSQPANYAFNIYRFTAQAGSYAVLLSNYATTGQLLLYRIVNDACATSGTMSVSFITSVPIAGPSFQTTFANAFIPGQEYLLAVYTTGALTNAFYTITIQP